MSISDRDDLYEDNFYDFNFRDRMRDGEVSANVTGKFPDEATTGILRISLAVLLRIGFLLVQVGSVPVDNVNLILLQNIIDFCTVTVVYSLIGYLIAFNGDVSGIIGSGVWIGDSAANMDEAVVGWVAAITASAICTCGIIGRMHAIGYLLTAILMSGILQPFLIHWAWSSRGWMADSSLAGHTVYFRDYSGAGVVHVVGGLSGLLGCIVLGRRVLRLSNIDEASLPANSPGNATSGCFLIFIGLQGLSLPYPAYGRKQVGESLVFILINNLLAASSSALFLIGLHFALSREEFNYWTVMRCAQGAVSGVVTVAAGVDLYSPLIVICMSCCSGGIFYLVSRRLYGSALEDSCNIVAIHVACALFGSLLAPLCGKPRGSEINALALVLDAVWQLICILVLLIVIVLVMGPLFVLLNVCGVLRNRAEQENHLRAMLPPNNGPARAFLDNLYGTDGENSFLEPSSPNKIVQRSEVISLRPQSYRQDASRLEQRGSKQFGDTSLSELAAEPSSSRNADDEDRVSLKSRRNRQVFTLHTVNGPRTFEDLGGAGELWNNNQELRRKKLDSSQILFKLPPQKRHWTDRSSHGPTKQILVGLRIIDLNFDDSDVEPQLSENGKRDEFEGIPPVHARINDGYSIESNLSLKCAERREIT